jgi:hypothetical protein
MEVVAKRKFSMMWTCSFIHAFDVVKSSAFSVKVLFASDLKSLDFYSPTPNPQALKKTSI